MKANQRVLIILAVLGLLALVAAQCVVQQEQPGEPVTVVETVVVEKEKEVRVVETVEVVKEVDRERTVVEFWSTDNEEERVNVYEEVAASCMAQMPDVEIRILPIEEAGVSQRIATAIAANRRPDIIRMGVERVATFAADGILDQDAAMAVIQAIGEDDFREGPLRMVTDPTTGQYAAIPFDGWIQALWYREDTFNEMGLEPPIAWEDIREAACALQGQQDFLYGITLGTDPGQNYGHQVFEQVAMSNDAWPFDAEGNVTMNSDNMVQALDWYTSLQECAAPGPQYWRGGREAYQYAQAPMLFYSTYIMDDLVEGSELEEGGMVELALPDLAENTGFAPTMEGPNGEASYGQLVTLAIVDGADPQAQDVIQCFMTEGYQDILGLAPFGKVPVLKSAVDEWKQSSPYFENYDPETLEAIANGYETMKRWLFRPDYSATQRAVVGDIEGRLLIPQVISNIALEGSMTPEEGAQFLQDQVELMLSERMEEDSGQ